MIVTNLRFLRFSSASSSFSSNRIKLHNVNTSNKPFHSPNYPATIVTPFSSSLPSPSSDVLGGGARWIGASSEARKVRTLVLNGKEENDGDDGAVWSAARDDDARAHTHRANTEIGVRLRRALEFFARARRFANNSRSVSRRCVVPDASAIQPLNAEITSYLFVSRTQLRKFIHRPRSPVSVCEATRGPLLLRQRMKRTYSLSSSASSSSSSFSSSRARQTVASLINDLSYLPF